MKFEYKYVEGGFLCPIINVIIKGPSGETSVKMLVDTGAYYSVLPYHFLDTLGIDSTKCEFQRIQYGSSSSNGFKTNITFVINGFKFNADVVFVEKLNFSYPLLGRHSVFNKFKSVTFNESYNHPYIYLNIRSSL